ncbi:ABC transporter substrate-binding protein [Arthrobacter sp. efr-133-TYG-104]|uniref:ABC transporter substrate-binding protein n=1 Tax=Arthrobacter sp. efr-133-TYG-104 TaxID=3040324 RepID=UPI00254B4FD4|nr:ABC transporter substrate-binding protein [Arthrobacter sp. efr-133-TYG-104]
MTMNPISQEPRNSGGAFSRRTLLQVGGTAAFLGLGALTACTGKGGAGGQSSGGATPVRGGSLRVGATSGGSGDTLDAQNSLTTVDFIRAGALFEQLVMMNGATGRPELVLAESIEPNADATEWTIRVKPDIKFHNGKTLTSDDVLFSLRRIEQNKFPGLSSIGPIDLASAKVVDPRTLRIPFTAPFAIFVEGLADGFTTRIVPQGYDPAKPVGTGPFKFGSFTPGQRSSFPRFDEYWQNGQPYLNELVIINFADETAQINALQSGQIDLVNQLSSTSVAAVKSGGGKVVVSKTRGFVPLTMRVDTEPFSDVRVRQALRLLVNRDDLNEQVYGGLGEVGNDIYGAIDTAYEGTVPQRKQDLDQARSLLRAAGHSDLQIELVAAPTGPGAVAIASVFATQAKQAGVTVNIRTEESTQFWSQSYGKAAFTQSFWNTASYLTCASQGIADGAPFNEIHQNDPTWQSTYAKALATVDKNARDELVKELMKFDYEKGGYIIPVYFPGIEGMTSRVGGVSENITGIPINGGSGWQNIWLQGS